MNILSGFGVIISFDKDADDIKKIDYNNLTSLIIAIVIDYFEQKW